MWRKYSWNLSDKSMERQAQQVLRYWAKYDILVHCKLKILGCFTYIFNF